MGVSPVWTGWMLGQGQDVMVRSVLFFLTWQLGHTLPGAELLWLYGPGILCSFLSARTLVVGTGFSIREAALRSIKGSFCLI